MKMGLPVKKHLLGIERVRNPEKRLGKGILRLDKNENTIGFGAEFMDTLRKEVTSDFLSAYPEVDVLYEKIARWLKLRTDNIYLSSGSDAAIKSVFEVFVGPQDRVLLLSPTYAMFYVYAKIFQAALVEIHYKRGLELSVDEIIKALYDLKPKLSCIANPNSPTGTLISKEDLKTIVEAAAENNCVVLLDEAYFLFSPVSSIDMISRYPNLIVMRTFSKAFGLASARLGFAAGQPEIVSLLHKVRPLYEINAFAARFGELVLDNYHLVEKNIKDISAGRAFLVNELNSLRVPYYNGYGNFILINVGSFERSVKITEALREKKILIKGGFKEDVLKDCIRITLGNIDQMRRFVEAFKEILAVLQGGRL